MTAFAPLPSSRWRSSSAQDRWKSAGTPGLTVKTDTSLIDARKKWEQAVLQSQRDDAAARAKQVADAARNKAEMLSKFYSSQMLFLSISRGRRSVYVYKIAMKAALIIKRLARWKRGQRDESTERLVAFRRACDGRI